MPERLTLKTIRNLRALCRRFSAEHNLGWDVQKELYSRMEERFLVIVSGTAKVTDEEAFILIRKHFSEPERIREFTQETNDNEARSDFYGRIATLFIATLGFGLIAEILIRLLCLGVYSLSSGSGAYESMAKMVVALGEIILPPLLLLGGFIFWRSTKEGRKYWFQNTGPYNILTVIILLIVVPELLWNIPVFREHEVLPYGYTVCLALQSMVWLIWCDATPRWKWGTVICPFFWVFYEATVHPLILAFGLFTTPMNNSLLIFDQRFLSMHIPALLRIAGVTFGVYLLLYGLRNLRRKNSEAAVR